MTTYDLSHPLESGMPTYPGDPPVEIESNATIAEDGYATTAIGFGSHAGTHVDAPAHLIAGGRTLGSYPPETFRFRAVVADVGPLEARDPIDAGRLGDGLPADDTLSPDETVDADLVVVRTGWDDYWGTDRYVDHPYLTVDAAERLLECECHLGIDAPNPDPTPTERAAEDEPSGFPVHRAVLGDDRLIVENLCGLESVADRFDLHAYPLSIRDADASPVRAVAVADGSGID